MDPNIHVLMIEDNPEDAAALKKELRESKSVVFDVVYAATLAEGLARLNSNSVDVILLDLGLPDSKGEETLHRVTWQAPDLPIVILTVSDDDALAVRAISQGAQDYLVKGTVDKRLLSQAIRYATHRKHAELALREAVDVSEKLRQEIAERKQADEALREREKQLRRSQRDYATIFEASIVGKAQADPATGRLIRVNPALAAMTGFSIDELCRMAVSDLTHPDDRQRDAEVLAPVREGRADNWQIEKRYVKKDGSIIWVNVAGNVVRDPDGSQTYAIAVIQDITDRRRAEVALREREEQLRLFVEHAPAAIAMFDTQMRYLAVSRRWQADFGLTGRDVLGQSHYELFPEVPQRWRDIHRRCLAGAVERAEEDRFERADGSVQWVRWEVRPWTTAAGDIGGIVIFSEEITERKSAEDALRESEQRLRLAQQAARIGTFDWDVRAKVNTWSPELEAMYGLRPGEFGKSQTAWEQLVHPDDRPAAIALVNQAFQTGLPAEGEWRVVWPDGSTHWIFGRFQAFRDEAGSPIRLTGVNIDITQRKRIEEELRKSHDELEARVKDRTFELADAVETLKESEEKFRVVAENSRAVFGIIQGNHFIYANPYLAELTGYSQAELLEMDFFQVVHPAFRPMMVDRARRRMMGEALPSHYEFVLLTRSGQERWLDFSVGRIVLRGQPALVGAAFDITERKRAEESLREQAALLNLAHDAIIVRGQGDKVTFWSQGAQKTYGFTREEAMGQVTHDLLKTHFPKPLTEIAAEMEQEGCWEGELIHTCQDGRQITVASRWAAQSDSAGQQVGVMEINRDITERKRAEVNQALMAEVLGILNRGGELNSIIGDALSAIQRVAGFDAVGLRLRKGDEWPYFEQRGFSDEFVREENFLCALDSAGAVVRESSGQVKLECTCGLVVSGRTVPDMPCFTASGCFWTNRSTDLLALPREEDPRDNPRNRCVHTGYQSVGLFPVRAGGETIGLLQLNDRREGRFTPELLGFYESLAQNIGMALQRASAEEAVRHAAEELQRSNKDLEQFAYVASHDLREPLRGVSMFLELLRKQYGGKLDEKAKEYIAFAVDGADRMSAMIRDLLTYARAGGAAAKPAAVDLRAVLDHVVSSLRATIEETHASITAGALPSLTADEGQMRQLFQNLIGNALKFHAEGRRPEISIDACRQADHWVFQVKDNGIGIDSEQVDRVFDLFTRLHGIGKYPGSGMGLAICRRIVERHGGRIWLESRPGQGSTFFFTLPEHRG